MLLWLSHIQLKHNKSLKWNWHSLPSIFSFSSIFPSQQRCLSQYWGLFLHSSLSHSPYPMNTKFLFPYMSSFSISQESIFPLPITTFLSQILSSKSDNTNWSHHFHSLARNAPVTFPQLQSPTPLWYLPGSAQQRDCLLMQSHGMPLLFFTPKSKLCRTCGFLRASSYILSWDHQICCTRPETFQNSPFRVYTHVTSSVVSSLYPSPRKALHFPIVMGLLHGTLPPFCFCPFFPQFPVVLLFSDYHDKAPQADLKQEEFILSVLDVIKSELKVSAGLWSLWRF